MTRPLLRWLASASLVGLGASALGARSVHAQSAGTVGTARMLQGDYAVPDAPALKMLEVDESALLRPATVRALTTALSSATGDFSFIPRSLGVELSPLMLVNGQRLTITEYRQHPAWYRMRVSVAARRDSSSARTQLALGVRLALEDQSDLRTNREFERAILALTDWKRDSIDLVTRRAAAAGVPVSGQLTPEQQERKAQVERDVAAELSASSRGLREAVKAAREHALWNANVFDVALAMRTSSADTIDDHASFDGVAGWLTKGFALAPGAQLLIGGRGAYERNLAETGDTDLHGTGDAAVRLYAGDNQYKLLAEVQGTGRQSALPQWLANVGGELQLARVLWIQASAGWKSEGAFSNGRYVSSFKVKFNPPGT